MSAPETYLDTLRRIPDDIILAIGAQDFDECSFERCVCGWALRERLARELNVEPESVKAEIFTVPGRCSELFSGDYTEWHALFQGAMMDTLNVETAFVDRLNEIVPESAS